MHQPTTPLSNVLRATRKQRLRLTPYASDNFYLGFYIQLNNFVCELEQLVHFIFRLTLQLPEKTSLTLSLVWLKAQKIRCRRAVDLMYF